MSRLTLVDPDNLSGERKAQYDRFPSNLTRALLLLDDRLAGALPQTANALRTAPLDPAWREAVILRVAALHHSGYERFQHLGQALQQGWTAEQIDAIEYGRPGDGVLPAELTSILRFVDEVVAGPTVSGDVFDAAHALLNDQELVTVIVLIGHYMTVARILGVLQVPLDSAPDSWDTEH